MTLLEVFKAPFHPLRRLYCWTVERASGKGGERFLALVSFADSSFFPIPPDVALIPVVLSAPHKAKRATVIASVSSVLGGVFGYLIGLLLYHSIGIRIVHFYHLERLVASVGQRYDQHAFLTVFLAAFTPIPYKLITISAGLFKISFLPFFIASAVGRTGRFALVAWIVGRYGERAKMLIEKYFELAAILFTLLFIAGFYALEKYVR